MKKPKPKRTGTCAHCGASFSTHRESRKYCSDICRFRARWQRINEEPKNEQV